MSTDQEIFYFNDNDKHIYKINYNKDVIDKRSLEKKDNKNSIGNAKKLLLTSPDNKYLVLGTSVCNYSVRQNNISIKRTQESQLKRWFLYRSLIFQLST